LAAATTAAAGIGHGAATPAPQPMRSPAGTEHRTLRPNGSPGTSSRTATALPKTADAAYPSAAARNTLSECGTSAVGSCPVDPGFGENVVIRRNVTSKAVRRLTPEMHNRSTTLTRLVERPGFGRRSSLQRMRWERRATCKHMDVGD
jgi:hypothetical protein